MTTRTPTDSLKRVAAGLAEAEHLRLSGRIAAAEAKAREILAAVPDAAPPMNFLALLLRDRGEFAEAERWMRRAIAVAPREAASRNNLGNLLRTLGDLPGAESSLRAAIALKSDYADAFYNLGVVLRELQRPEEALAAQRRAAALRPRYVQALTQLGLLLQESERYEESLRMLDEAIAARRDYFDAHYYRGCTLTALDRYDEAVAALNIAVSLKPAGHEAYFALGNALVRARREDEALVAYGRAVEAAPTFLPAHREFNALAWTMGRTDLNLKSYARARARVGDTADLLLAEADQRLRHDEANAAEQLLRRAHALEPDRFDVTNTLARALMMRRNFAESIDLLQHGIARDPHAMPNHRALAMALLQSGEAAEARRVLLDQALKLAPLDQLSLALLALAYRELGDSRLGQLVDLEKFVGVYDLPPPPGFGDVESFHRALGEDLIGLHTRKVEPFDQTLRGGTQTPGYLFENPTKAIEGVRQRISEAVADYVKRLPDDPSHPLMARKDPEFDFSGAWSCRLRSSGFHTNHIHPQGWISSAYYVSLPDAVSDTSGQQGWLKFGESSIELGERDRPDRVVKPAVGKLVLFPSYFWHGTVPFASEDTRLTIAFDVVPGKARSGPKSSAY